MPDDYRTGGARPPAEDPGRHRRHQMPPEQPRRRRRSMEAGGGTSVFDLVQRHTGSRPNLPAPPPPPRPDPPARPTRAAGAPPPPDRRAQPPVPQPPAQQPPPARAPRQPPRPAEPRPRAVNGRRSVPPPGESTGARQWPGEVPVARQQTNGRPAPGTGRHEVPPRQDSGPRQHPPAARERAAQPGRPDRGSASRPLQVPRQAPGQASSPGSAAAPDRQQAPLPPPRRPQRAEQQADDDPISLTTEMEAIGEATQKRRTIDHTLARFSKVHDELRAEERQRKAKRRKLLPWGASSDSEIEELDRLDDSVGLRKSRPADADDVQAGEPGGGEPGGKPPRGSAKTRLQEKKVRRRHRSVIAGRTLAAAAAVLVLVATGAAWGFKTWIDQKSQHVDALDENSAAIQDAGAQQGDENFLMVGSDTRAGAKARDGVGTENTVGGARSDTVMIAHIPASRERVVVVSFPRDLEINRPACEEWNAKSGDYTGRMVAAERAVKLNTAYSVGGPKCVTKVIQQLSGLKINHFVGIDFGGFKDMVDAIDGVQVCVEEPLIDDILGPIVPQAGKRVTISGQQALNFVRARHVQGDPTSDYGRIKRQQRFLSSLLRKAMSSEVLLDPGKLTNFVNAFTASTFGDNIGVDQMVMLGQSMQGLDAGKVTFITVPTVGYANERGNEVLRTEDTDALFKAIRDDARLPGEQRADGDQRPAEDRKSDTERQAKAQPLQQDELVDPSTLKIQVLNSGNPTAGIAGNTADKLTELGFQVMRVDNGEEVPHTVVRYSAGNEAAAQTLAAAVPGAELEEDPSMAGALILMIGPDYDGTVVDPSKSGSGEKPEPLPDNLDTINGGDVSCA